MSDPIPPLPDSERRTRYVVSVASAGPFDVGFDLYGTDTDYTNWIEVWQDGVRVTNWTLDSPTGSLAVIARPITDARITFTTAQTGTIDIVGADRPRRVSQYTEGAGVTARDHNISLNTIIARLRETWDRSLRGLRVPPGEVLSQLPPAADRASKYAWFDADGDLSLADATDGGGSGGPAVPVSIAEGGTAATTEAAAVTNLGIGQVSVAHYGALPSAGGATNVAAFQAAIDATTNSGVQLVVVPPGTYAGDFSTLSLGSRNRVVLRHLGEVIYSGTAPLLDLEYSTYSDSSTPPRVTPAYRGSISFHKDSDNFAADTQYVVPNVRIQRDSNVAVSNGAGGFQQSQALLVNSFTRASHQGSVRAATFAVTNQSTSTVEDDLVALTVNVSDQTGNKDRLGTRLALDIRVTDKTEIANTETSGPTVGAGPMNTIEASLEAYTSVDDTVDGARHVLTAQIKNLDNPSAGPATFGSGLKIKNQNTAVSGEAWFLKGIWLSPKTNNGGIEYGIVEDQIKYDGLTITSAGRYGIVVDMTANNDYTRLHTQQGLRILGLPDTTATDPSAIYVNTQALTAAAIRIGSARISGSLATLSFFGRNSVAVDKTFAQIDGRISDGTTTAEWGRLDINVPQAGTLTTVATFGGVSTVESSLTLTKSLHVHNATGMVGGGTVGGGLKLSSVTNFGVFFGSGAPSIAAAQGSLYLRSNGSSTSTRAYINTDGGTTWTAITTAA